MPVDAGDAVTPLSAMDDGGFVNAAAEAGAGPAAAPPDAAPVTPPGPAVGAEATGAVGAVGRSGAVGGTAGADVAAGMLAANAAGVAEAPGADAMPADIGMTEAAAGTRISGPAPAPVMAPRVEGVVDGMDADGMTGPAGPSPETPMAAPDRSAGCAAA